MLLPAADVRYKSGDSEYRYRPDSEMLYVTGWEEGGSVAVLRGHAAKDRFVLFVPERDGERERWTGPRLDPGEVKARFGADAVFPMTEFRSRAPALLADGDRIHYRLGASAVCDDVVREALRAGRARRARKGAGAYMVVDPGAVLDAMRVRKDAAEVARLREAARISVAAFREALGRVRPGAGEWEVEAALEAGFRRRGAGGPAFATIVGAGANACTLHYTANRARIGSGDLVLMDAGAEFDYYAADITRTVPAWGRLEGARRDAYEIVREAHRAALAACRPGGTLDDVHEAASRVIAGGLVGMGVVEGTVDEVLEGGAHRVFFPHKTSHWLGLDTHDVGAYWRAGYAGGAGAGGGGAGVSGGGGGARRAGADGGGASGPVELEPGMVFTVEPGLYFPPGSCNRVPELDGTGIRIEDDVLIGEDGAEVLTGELPVELEELAPLIGAAS